MALFVRIDHISPQAARQHQSYVNGDWPCQFEMANFNSYIIYEIDTRQPIAKKCVTGDFVGDCYSCGKFGAST